MTVVTNSPMDKKEDVVQAKTENSVEIPNKDKEIEPKWLIVEICLLILVFLFTYINVRHNIDVNTMTGDVKIMGDVMALKFSVQVFFFVVAWKSLRSCPHICCVAVLIMSFIMLVLIQNAYRMEPGIGHMRSTVNQPGF